MLNLPSQYWISQHEDLYAERFVARCGALAYIVLPFLLGMVMIADSARTSGVRWLQRHCSRSLRPSGSDRAGAEIAVERPQALVLSTSTETNRTMPGV